jgi:hypothetical protein
MFCSSCGKVVRPVVAVDIDGTLGDYHGHFIDFLARYLGLSPHPRMLRRYRGQEGFKEYAMETFNISEAEWKDIKLAYRQGAQKRTMPIFSWAQPMCELIRMEGAELWVTTTRPYLRLDNVDPDTRAWLRHHGIRYDGLIYDKYKYQRLAENVDPERVVAVVDDLSDKVEEAREVFGTDVPVQRLTIYNGYSENTSLRLITGLVLRRIEEWKELHP